MYKLKENRIDDFLYTGSQLMNKEGNTFEYVAKNNQLHILRNMETGEMEEFTTFELRNMYAKEPLYYCCEFVIGDNQEWQTVNGQRYMQLDAWDAVVGAMEWLNWDYMEESEKAGIFIKLLDSKNNIMGIYDADELEKISYGAYEPWKEV